MADLQIVPIQLDEAAEKQLLQQVADVVNPAADAHKVRCTWYAEWRKAYKARPKDEIKNFPWPNASNIVVPLIGMTVDAIVARLSRAMLGTKDFAEVEIKSPQWEKVKVPSQDPEKQGMPTELNMEKEIRDWISHFIKASGSRDRLRTIFNDATLLGDAIVKPIWSSETRIYHGYDSSGAVVEMPVPEYEGVRWHVPSPDDIVPATGFDEWATLPFVVNILRYTWADLLKLKADGTYRNIDELKTSFATRSIKKTDAKVRSDQRHVDAVETANLGSPGPAQIFEIYEIQGKWEVPAIGIDGATTTVVEEVILSYSRDFNLFIRTIFNPFFGRSRHLIRVPFLLLPHELHGYGIAEQILQFQHEASTSHNQVIDAGTAANAGIVVTSPHAEYGKQQEIYPGKHIVTDDPKNDFAVYHIGANSSILGTMEEKAIRYAEARSGVSAYHLGMESSIVGSRATATGTTALIGEGNLRFWMSIDDIRHSIEELLYLTIQLEQQMRPQGYEWAPGRFIQFPQGDVRTSLGLSLFLTSEKINRDMEIQNLVQLMSVLNEYYARVMQAAAIIASPAFPEVHKIVIMQVMSAAESIIRRFVERYDIENIDDVVPGLMETVNTAMRVLQGVQGPGATAQPGSPAAPPGGPAGGAPGGPPPPQQQQPPG